MSYPFEQNFTYSQKEKKPIFVTMKNNKRMGCNFWNLLTFEGISICHQDAQQNNISFKAYNFDSDMPATKLSKRSLKTCAKSAKNLLNTVNSGEIPEIKTYPKTEQKITNSNYQIEREASKVLSKTTSSEIGFTITNNPAAGYSQVSKLTKHSYKDSSENLICSSYQNTGLRNSQNFNHSQRFSQIQMVESISRNNAERMSKNNVERISGMSFSRMRKTVNPEVIGLTHPKFIGNFTQNLQTLGISPIKQMVIPEVSEYSALNSHNPTQREEFIARMSTDWKLPQLNKNTPDEWSNFLQATPFKQNQKIIKQISSEIHMTQNNKPKIEIHDENNLKYQASQNDFLEISFEENQGQQSQKFPEKDLNKETESKISVNQDNNLNKQQNKSQANSHENNLAYFKAENQLKPSQIEELEQTGHPNEQCKKISNFKAPRLNHLPSGRHSVQIPKSKKFSGMKVRRTISMRDQEDSQQEQTSQVIYGYRQTQKEPIIEDINQDMQESRMNALHKGFDNSTINNFRQLLL